MNKNPVKLGWLKNMKSSFTKQFRAVYGIYRTIPDVLHISAHPIYVYIPLKTEPWDNY